MFPHQYARRKVPRDVVHRLLEAAMWAPYHGPVAPWRFVVLGKEAMVEMQNVTLQFYDDHWQEVGWANGKHGSES